MSSKVSTRVVHDIPADAFIDTEDVTLITTTPLGIQTVRALPSLFTDKQIMVLVTAVPGTTFPNIFQHVHDNTKYDVPAKKVAEDVLYLASKGYLKIEKQTQVTNKTHTYYGTLTVSPDGTITFMPDCKEYTEVFGVVPLLTIKGAPKNLMPFKPFAIVTKIARIIGV